MNLLVNGASFSYGNNSWPELLGATNLSCMNVGNTYIADSTINELAKKAYDLVIIMWSPFEFDANTDMWTHYEANLMTMLGLQEFFKQRQQKFLFAFARPLKVFDRYQHLYDLLENVYPVAFQPIVKAKSWYAEDGVHPSKQAHEYYATELKKYLERL